MSEFDIVSAAAEIAAAAPTPTITLRVELGALAEVPAGCWESHRRGKNWFAVIRRDPTAPGGLGRVFQARARGEWFYLVGAEIRPGVPVEFGADYYSARGNPSRTRWYGAVVAVSEDALVLEPAPTAAQACKLAAIRAAGQS